MVVVSGVNVIPDEVHVSVGLSLLVGLQRSVEDGSSGEVSDVDWAELD